MLRRPLLLLFVLTVIAGILRFLMAGWYLQLNNDATYLFLPCAHAIAAGDWEQGLDHTIPTGFLFLHVFWVWVGQLVAATDPVFWARLLTALLGTACVPLTYAFARCFLTPQFCLLASAFVAFSFKGVEFSGRVSSEVPYAATLVLAAWMSLLAIRRSHWGWSVASGLSIGVAYLVRPEGMALLPLTLVGLTWQWKIDRQQRSVFWRIPLLVAAFALGALPMIVVNYQATGRLSLSNKGGISLERHQQGPELSLTNGNRITRLRYQLSREGYRPFSMTDVILEDPLGFAGRSAQRSYKFLIKYLPRIMGVGSTIGVVLLLLASVFRRRVTPWSGHLRAYVGGNLLLYLAALSLFFPSDRFVLPLAPLLAVVAAAGWATLLAVMATSQKAGLRTRATLLLLGVVLCVDLGLGIRQLNKFDGWELGWRNDPNKLLALEINKRFAAERVLSPDGEIAYHMGAHAVIWPSDSYSNLLEYCRHQEVEFIIYRTVGSTASPRDSVHKSISEWPLHPTELQDCGVVQASTPIGPVFAHVWRVDLAH